jgi:acetylornithine deacetylase/succinyl-diaminopimelate desuccinylase-like protein
MLARGKPAITYGIRGLVYTEVILHGADQDLHSGSVGRQGAQSVERTRAHSRGALGRRPPRHAARLLRSRAADRGGRAPSVARTRSGRRRNARKGRAAARGRYRREAGYTAIEREWARPTAEINGLIGGYTGAGAKTVIPSHATAKVSFRLVADQEPDAVRDAFFAWLRERTPPGCRWDFIDHAGGWPATVPTDYPWLRAASRAVERATGLAPALVKSGGSIPVAGMLKAQLDMETIFMGFGLDDDRMHSPNEKFELDCFRAGARAHVLMIDELRGGGDRSTPGRNAR